MLNRWLMPMLLGLVVLVCVAGCSGSGDDQATPSNPAEDGTAAGEKVLRIAVIPKGTTHEFWKSVHAGAAKAAKEFV